MKEKTTKTEKGKREKGKKKTTRKHFLKISISKNDLIKLNKYCTKKGCCSYSSVIRDSLSEKFKEAGL